MKNQKPSNRKAGRLFAPVTLLGDDLFGSSISISSSKDGQECMEELSSRRIDELMDLGVFREEWQRVFGDEVGMLVKESLRVKPHEGSGLASD